MGGYRRRGTEVAGQEAGSEGWLLSGTAAYVFHFSRSVLWHWYGLKHSDGVFGNRLQLRYLGVGAKGANSAWRDFGTHTIDGLIAFLATCVACISIAPLPSFVG